MMDPGLKYNNDKIMLNSDPNSNYFILTNNNGDSWTGFYYDPKNNSFNLVTDGYVVKSII